MLRAPLALLVLLLLPASVAEAHVKAALPGERPPRHVPGELLVRFEPGADPQARAAARAAGHARRVASLPVPGLQLVEVGRGRSLRAAAAALRREPGVAYVQRNNYYRLAGLPNDPRFGELWGLANSGQAVNGSAAGSPDADVDASDAWDLTTGRRSLTVAIVDSGIAYDHPDLKPNLWTNSGESGRGRESNGRDDDRNGLVDDWRGYDFADRDNDPRDPNGHGTHVAGIVGARGNNGVGVAGLNWQVGLMGLRVADANGLVTDTAIISAFDYAAREGARVVNASFVSPSYSASLRDAIRRNPRTLFIAAAGNGDDRGVGVDNDRLPQYPCGFTLVNLVCVAASNQADQLTAFSNFGRKSVQIAAPGANVLSSSPAYDTVFADGFEGELAGIWVTGGTNNTWGRITTVSHSGGWSLSDSPGTTYLDNSDSFVQTASPFSLAGRSGCRLDYSVRLWTEPQDKLVVELSHDGATWAAIDEASGFTEGSFLELTDDLSDLDGTPALWLRFRLITNASVTADGAQLDDVSVRCLSGTYSGGELVFNDGTSMAAPHVSGAAALVLARYRGLGPAGVRTALERGADDRPAFAGKVGSGGRLNARRAIEAARKLEPSLRLSSAKRQRAGRDGRVSVRARCGIRCTAVASGSVTVPGATARLPLKRVARTLPAERRKKLVLRLSRRSQERVRRALARGRRVIATVKVSATDRLGGSAKARRVVRLRR